ncbi:MAG: ATP synthase F1 subunit gamma [Thermomicrobiales bacterium]|nr:ATP synthase F1 subunit gamma [Thermomicrobiales bacterium]
MPSPREVKRRMNSVKNMSQITRAMEMVAASKMRRAQERVAAGRPYADRLRDVLSDLASLQLDADELKQFPLLERREVKTSTLIVMTPDRGLSGPLNSNLFRRTAQYLRSESVDAHPHTIAVGKKGRDFLNKTGQNVVAEFIQLGDRPSLDDIRPIVDVAMQEFLSGESDAVYMLYPKFINTLSQVPTVIQLLPLERPEGTDSSNDDVDYIFEPDAKTVLQEILPRYLETIVYQAVLETVASFYSSQMVAMRNATDNAKELVDDLNLSYNKARQAQITNEVAEISAGANAFRVD